MDFLGIGNWALEFGALEWCLLLSFRASGISSRLSSVSYINSYAHGIISGMK